MSDMEICGRVVSEASEAIVFMRDELALSRYALVIATRLLDEAHLLFEQDNVELADRKMIAAEELNLFSTNVHEWLRGCLDSED